ncbi:MAG: aspartate ammonia-lyase [Deltaproteobacteria bacterium HGW-Deltaproteobacteria-19]|jgi:aspartate ammonia-lyase|nr:MAG: aspartate ammonia-lyase [Deltaproteobacteria bacterium HGW-Deltaproteobacteria-19]
MTPTRTEKDLLGDLEIPADAYWGIHTLRAVRNFPLSGRSVNAGLIRACALVKKACCLANAELGYLDAERARAIEQACDEVAAGGLAGQFPVDALQGGAGTSTNMNVNEVLANRAIEILGGRKGDYALVHPLEHVNLHQSTNDTYPTAVKVAGIFGLRSLSRAAADLQGAFQEKEKAFGAIVKVGRTELQEAVPMTLGAEFAAFAEALSRDRWRTFKGEERLRVVNLGGTAVGTGLAAPRDYIFLVIEKLRETTGQGLSRGENLTGETAFADAFVEVSGVLKAHAANLVKIAGDLRLLNLLGEIRLPDLQAGSSIMPGKVNPVLAEAAIQVGLKVFANDAIVSDALSRGTGQISEFLPLAADAFLESLDLLARADALLAEHVRGIEADEEACRRAFDRSPMLVTALVPHLGYERATELIREYRELERQGLSESRTMRAFLEEKLGKEMIDRVLSPWSLTALGYRKEN